MKKQARVRITRSMITREIVRMVNKTQLDMDTIIKKISKKFEIRSRRVTNVMEELDF